MSPKYYMLIVPFLLASFTLQGQTTTPIFEATTAPPSHKLVFKIYPNPMVGKVLNIKTSESGTKSTNIYDIMGNLVIQMTTPEDKIVLDELKTGIYILKLQVHDKVGIKRLVVQ